LLRAFVTAATVVLFFAALVWGDHVRNKPFFALGASAAESASDLSDEGSLPDLSALVTAESTSWINSAPLDPAALRGKVVVVDFWTYSCINSLRNLPYLQAWAEKYKDAGLVVIGAHTPEFTFEKDLPNIERAVREYRVTYPVAIDSEYAIWKAFDNEYWPADYFIDGKGRIRYHHFGEGDYDESERVIQQLLAENGAMGVPGGTVRDPELGVEAPASNDVLSPETYVGYRRAENFASPEARARDSARTYSVPARISLNQYALSGLWDIGAESGVLVAAPGKIAFRFHSRDLHLVMGPAKPGGRVRYRVTIDGKAPGQDRGIDAGSDGAGEVIEPRLYQLVRQHGRVEDRTFEIEFLDPGVAAYVFTFG
jgi:thiol-disulfide isomerase/thioredoxin